MSKVWRTGPHRARLITQSVWDLKQSLESVGSGLVIRVGMFADVVKGLLDGFRDRQDNVGAVWMTGEEGVEERRDQRAVSAVCKKYGIDFELWADEKYYVDELVVVSILVPPLSQNKPFPSQLCGDANQALPVVMFRRLSAKFPMSLPLTGSQ